MREEHYPERLLVGIRFEVTSTSERYRGERMSEDLDLNLDVVVFVPCALGHF